MHLPPETQSNFKPAPVGNHRAICVHVIDLGTHMESYMGEPPKPRRKVRIVWELPDELMEDGRPFTIGQKYTLSSAPNAKFREHLESWRGRKFEAADFGPAGFKPSKLLGAACLLNITHTEKGEKTYANIAGISPLPKSMTKPTAINGAIYFSMDEAAWDSAAFGSLPDYWRKEIEKSPEFLHWRDHKAPPASEREPPPMDDIDDVPF